MVGFGGALQLTVLGSCIRVLYPTIAAFGGAGGGVPGWPSCPPPPSILQAADTSNPPTPVHKLPSGRRRSRSSAVRWMDLSDFYDCAGARLIAYLEQTLDLFAKLCVGGNMRAREVVSKFVTKEILVAVLGLDTPHDDIPDRLKSRFWSIASVLYLDKPSHTPTVLGVRTVVKDCSWLSTQHASQKSGDLGFIPPAIEPTSPCSLGMPSADEIDKDFLSAMKIAATSYLKQNTAQVLYQADRNILTKQVCFQLSFPDMQFTARICRGAEGAWCRVVSSLPVEVEVEVEHPGAVLAPATDD